MQKKTNKQMKVINSKNGAVCLDCAGIERQSNSIQSAVIQSNPIKSSIPYSRWPAGQAGMHAARGPTRLHLKMGLMWPAGRHLLNSYYLTLFRLIIKWVDYYNEYEWFNWYNYDWIVIFVVTYRGFGKQGYQCQSKYPNLT